MQVGNFFLPTHSLPTYPFFGVGPQRSRIFVCGHDIMFPGQLKVPEHISDDIMALEHLPDAVRHLGNIFQIVKSRILAPKGLQKGKVQ